MARLDDIRRRVIDAVAALEGEEVAVIDAAGRCLASPVIAALSAPPVSCSAMDGYAVREDDLVAGRAVRVVGTIYAGDAAPPPLGSGEALRIFTGAPVPENAMAVVPQEAARVDGDRVAAKGAVAPGAHIRRAGEDVHAGEVALEAGLRLTARAIGLCAAVGVERVAVVRAPRLTVIATGDEVVRGRTPDSNGPALAALARELGADVRLTSVGDDLDALLGTLRDAARTSDAVITIGGVSVGVKDLVPEALERAGARVHVHGVPMKPGKPFLFATLGTTPMFGMPGSPSACLVAFEVFARPALLRLCGAAHPFRPGVRAPAGEAIEGRAGRDRFVWARLDGAGRVWPLGRDSAQVRGPAIADVLLRIPEDTGDVPAGEVVEAWLLQA